VVDHLWYDYGASADRDRFTYGYDRASSRLYRENTVASGKDEYYEYDYLRLPLRLRLAPFRNIPTGHGVGAAPIDVILIVPA
jgi:hypothetical protein